MKIIVDLAVPFDPGYEIECGSPLATIPIQSREPQVKDFGSYPDVVEAAAPDGVPGLKKLSGLTNLNCRCFDSFCSGCLANAALSPHVDK